MRWTGLLAALGVACGAHSAEAPTPAIGTASPPVKASAWSLGASAAAKETYDSNVYLQSETDLANQGSFVSTLLGQVTAAWTPAPFSMRVGYAPEASFFHSEPTEDSVMHRANADLGWKGAETSVDVGGSLVGIDGDSLGPTWSGPGGAPAAGGIAVRDRRDAAVYRASAQLKQNWGAWFVRPAFTFYDHDFQTIQKSTPGYQNYVDRSEFTAGADVGRKVGEKLPVWLGYRYGQQDQSPLLQFPEEYDSQFHRILAGVDGEIAPWLRAGVTFGPEFRTYADTVPAAFGSRHEQNFYLDGTVTAKPGKSDTVVFAAKKFEQPGFSGRAVYEDLTLDVSWRHRFRSRWTVGLGGRAYNTDFLEPAQRDDWILSVNGLVHCAITPKLSAEGSYAFEDGETETPDATGHEFKRHLVALGVKYTFH